MYTSENKCQFWWKLIVVNDFRDVSVYAEHIWLFFMAINSSSNYFIFSFIFNYIKLLILGRSVVYRTMF